LQKRFMSRLGIDKKLSLFAHRVGLAAGELAAQEAVPWSSRDPATQACAIIYGVVQINRVRCWQEGHQAGWGTDPAEACCQQAAS
jgi:hypothetical protein